MKIAGVDFEATGVDALKERIIEIGCITWDEKYQEGIRYSQLVSDFDYPSLTLEVQRVTGLDPAELYLNGVAPKGALQKLTVILNGVDAVFAHNKAYDETLYLAECERAKITPSGTPWYCTLHDVSYPSWQRCKQLSHLALDHGITVDPSRLHRAVDDVALMGELLRSGGYSPESIIAFSQSPWVYLLAVIPAPWEDGGRGKAAAQAQGFNWETCRGTAAPRYNKRWVKRVKLQDFDAFMAQDLGFKVDVEREK